MTGEPTPEPVPDLAAYNAFRDFVTERTNALNVANEKLEIVKNYVQSIRTAHLAANATATTEAIEALATFLGMPPGV